MRKCYVKLTTEFLQSQLKIYHFIPGTRGHPGQHSKTHTHKEKKKVRKKKIINKKCWLAADPASTNPLCWQAIFHFNPSPTLCHLSAHKPKPAVLCVSVSFLGQTMPSFSLCLPQPLQSANSQSQFQTCGHELSTFVNSYCLDWLQTMVQEASFHKLIKQLTHQLYLSQFSPTSLHWLSLRKTRLLHETQNQRKNSACPSQTAQTKSTRMAKTACLPSNSLVLWKCSLMRTNQINPRKQDLRDQ